MGRDLRGLGQVLVARRVQCRPRAFFWSRLWLVVALVAGLVIAVAPVRQASAATLVVMDAGDSGATTLRGRVSAATAGDTITFAPSLNGQTITLTSGLINLNKNLTIQGPGVKLLAVSGNHGGRIFNVASNMTVSITGLTLKDGNSGSNGGAIYNGGTLIVANSAISGNNATSYGGGIFNADSSTLIVTNSTISGNTVGDGNSGGGIFNNNNGIVTVLNSTITGNTASYGAGIFNDVATATVVNTTISGNTATTRGGGVSNSTNGILTLRNVTFSGNGAPSGGGQLHTRTSAVTTLVNTILANSAQGPNCGVEAPGTQIDGGHNLDDGTSCGFAAPSLSSTNPQLDPAGLRDNGGPTQTIALLTGSPAIDAAEDASCAATPGAGLDQRGITRPQGLHCDIGAVENAVPTLTALNPTSVTVGSVATPLTITGTNFAPGATVSFGGTTLTPSSVAPGTIVVTLPASLLDTARTVAVTVTNPGLGGGTSGTLTFAVNNPAPTITNLNPSSATAGGGSFALAVTGTNFVTSSVIDFGGQTLATTLDSGTQVSATVPASAILAAGTIAVRVSTPGPGGGASSTLSFVVNPAGANQVTFAGGNAQSTVVNTDFSTALAVTVRDAFGNLVPAGIAVTFTAPVGGASGTFPGNLTTVSANTDASGVATAPTFTANGLVGAYSVIASAGGGAIPFALTNTPGPATQLAVSAPASATAGAAITVGVTVQDAAGNTVPGYTGTVHFTSGDGQAVLPADYTFVVGDAGVRTFAATLKTAGSQAITATDTVTSGITGSASVAVLPATAVSLVATAGTPQDATVATSFAAALAATVHDAFNNPVPGVAVTFAAPTSGPGGTFPGGGSSVTVGTDGAGVATAPTFAANGNAGGYAVVASSVAGVAFFALTNTPGAATRLVVSAPTQASAGAAFNVTVDLRDASGNPVPGYTGTVHFTSGDGAAILPADYPFVGGDAGSHTFAVTLKTAGSQTIVATDTVNGALTDSATVGVAATAVASIAASGGTPQSAQVNTTFAAPLVAVVRDASGNPLPNVTVTFTTPGSGPSGTFGGGPTATAVTDGNGVATAPTLVANGTAGAYLVSASASGVATPATFALTNTAAPVPTATVTVTTTGGGGVAPGTGAYPLGTTVAFTATPDTGKLFLGWTVDGTFVGVANPLALPVTGARVIGAAFATRPSFGDVPGGDPAAEAIAQLAARGIIKGYADGGFGPHDQTLRSQSAALIARAMGWDQEFHGNLFPDRCDQDGRNCIDDELWNAVAALNFYNVARGYSDAGSCATAGTTTPCYLPRVPVANVQVIAFITRAMVARGYWQQATADDVSIYPNVPAASGHRLDLVTYVKNAGAVPGLPAGGPFAGYDQPATRAFFAQALWQAYNAYFGTNHIP